MTADRHSPVGARSGNLARCRFRVAHVVDSPSGRAPDAVPRCVRSMGEGSASFGVIPAGWQSAIDAFVTSWPAAPL